MTAIEPTALKVVRVADLGQEEVLTSAHNDNRQGLVHFINPTGFATLAQADSEVNIGLRDDEGVVIGVASTKPRTYLDNEGVTLLRDADIFLGEGVLDGLMVGAPIFLSATVPGGLDDAPPVNESHIPVQVGYVVAAWRESGYDKLMRVDTLRTADVLTWTGGGVATYADVVTAQENDLWLRLNESAGSPINHGTLTLTVSQTNCLIEQAGQLGAGEAYDFDGAGSDGSRVVVTNHATLAAAATQRWAFLIRPDTLGPTDLGHLMNWGTLSPARHRIRFQPTNRLQVFLEGAITDAEAITANNTIDIGAWQWLFVDFDDADALGNGRRVRIFKGNGDGVTQLTLGTDTAMVGAIASMGNNDLILGNEGSFLRTADGLIDEIIVDAGSLWTTEDMEAITNTSFLA